MQTKPRTKPVLYAVGTFATILKTIRTQQLVIEKYELAQLRAAYTPSAAALANLIGWASR